MCGAQHCQCLPPLCMRALVCALLSLTAYYYADITKIDKTLIDSPKQARGRGNIAEGVWVALDSMREVFEITFQLVNIPARRKEHFQHFISSSFH